MTINTETFSSNLRERLVLLHEKKVLIARLSESDQSEDLTVPANCKGYGRIRHFRIQKDQNWSIDPLPNLPACKALGIKPLDVLRTQVFQLAGCNLRCWYCFVDYDRLSANTNFASFFTADNLIDLYLEEDDSPMVIDLSGGQPDLVPEWNYWMMQSLEVKGLKGKVFLWTDDNLSVRYLWKYMDKEQLEYMANYPAYARVGCFKGYDLESFAFNTLAEPKIFDRQFEIFRDLHLMGFDMYAYVTFTSLPTRDLPQKIKTFMDKLQLIHENLPLRTVPLKIDVFTPTMGRMKSEYKVALMFQNEVHQAWCEELNLRFTSTQRETPICDIVMAK